jgi:hypothetical protein
VSGSRRKITLSPSDFAHLYGDCRRCFWNKYGVRSPHDAILRPKRILPSVYEKMDLGISGRLMGLNSEEMSAVLKDAQKLPYGRTRSMFVIQEMVRLSADRQAIFSDICPNLPECYVLDAQKRVDSRYLVYEDMGIELNIGGYYDLLIRYPGTDEHEVTDIKVTELSGGKAAKYAPQVHAYAFALGKPLNSEPIKIDKLSILIWEPKLQMVDVSYEDCAVSMAGPIQRIEIEKNNKAFLGMMREIAELVSLKEAPPASAKCGVCAYSRKLGITMEIEAGLTWEGSDQ